MEAAISSFCKALSGVCNSVQSASASLSDNISRSPVPLESAASMFLNSTDKHVCSANGDLNHLESMVFGTVSFEELLGHCNEVLKINQKYISNIEDQISHFGYVPEMEIEAFEAAMDLNVDSKLESPNQLERPELTCGSVSVARSRRRLLDDDIFFEESLSLKNLGLSDACLATLSSQGASFLASPKESSQKLLSSHAEQPHGIETESHYETNGLNNGNAKDSEVPPKVAEISVSKDVYDSLPVYIRNLATWEELSGVVEKLNSFFSNGRENATFSQDDTEKLGLGRKGRSCLLMLLRLNQLAMENVDGSNFYRLNIADP